VGLQTVPVGSLSLSDFKAVLTPGTAAAVREAERIARTRLAGRAIWNVNSTARGGGVAELLMTLLPYARGAGVDARWAVIGGGPEFFALTKRLHNRLHGAAGDGGPLGETERGLYEATLAPDARELGSRLAPDDVVILHDPQTAGLIPSVRALGVPVIWRCHVGLDVPNAFAREAWRFLEPYVRQADAYVFSREAFVWDELDPARRAVIAPSIDVLSPKNAELEPGAVDAILSAAVIRRGGGARAAFRRLDGRTAVVARSATITQERPLARGDRYVLQVSRWDLLKDPLGVIDGFAEHVAPHTDAHLVCAGPDVRAVADDPEGRAVFGAARERWRRLGADARQRIHLALLPMADADENAVIVNALQRGASVVVQKSVAEGFGLTVAEAMWKRRAVVASRIGGIQDQIVDGKSGLLLDDPRDLRAFGAAVCALLHDPDRAATLGAAAHERVRERYLGTHSLTDYLALVERLIDYRDRNRYAAPARERSS
jgi:trehalose synthase